MRLLAPSTVGLLLLASCSNSSSTTGTFTVTNTSFAVAAGSPVAISGRRIAVLADEATTGAGGSMLNGDLDTTDSVAFVIDSVSKVETPLGVAARSLAWIGDELFLTVSEAADGREWNGDAMLNSDVLLHWNPLMAMPAFSAVIETGSVPTVASGRLYAQSPTTPVGATMSNLFFVDDVAPTVPVFVVTRDTTAELTLAIHSVQSGLLVLLANEVVQGRDLNGDTDSMDTAVLVLLDATNVAGVARSTRLALAPAAPTVRAVRRGTSADWVVGFLVDETSQGATNFNDPALFAGSWKPLQCIGFEDADTTDRVLHYLEFSDWNGDPVTFPPRNTGLVGTDRVLALATPNGHVATVSREGDEGTCDLNDDGDLMDSVLRWVEIGPQVLPPTSAANLHAVANVPGGTKGVAELQGRFVVVVSEAGDEGADYDGSAGNDFDLVAWVTPGTLNAEVPYRFDHSTNNSNFNFGATWMQEREDRQRLYVAVPEDVEPTSGTRNGDMDLLDSLGAYAGFVSGPRLQFAGTTQALASNPGLVLFDNWAFQRVDESADSVDWNGDMDTNDIVLLRTSTAGGPTVFLSQVANLNRPVVEAESGDTTPFVVSFVRDENAEGVDLNGDMDTTDRVRAYFRL